MLTIKSLCVQYGGVQAVQGLTMHVEAGKIVSLVGANGAGKTSTLNAITGLVPSTGTIQMENDNLRRLDTDAIVRRGVSQVPQGRQLFPDMSVMENLEMGAFLRTSSEMAETLQSLQERFPILTQRRDQPAGTLSGGEQQMVAIARALMSAPKLLLLDEPCLGLAPLMVREIGAIIRELNAQGITILLAEQNASFASSIAHELVVVENGKVTLQGSPDELRKDDRMRKAYLGL